MMMYIDDEKPVNRYDSEQEILCSRDTQSRYNGLCMYVCIFVSLAWSIAGEHAIWMGRARATRQRMSN